MRIDRLTMRNFCGFEDCTIDLDPHLTLLVGDNGSGKSSVLTALSILLDSWILGIKGDETGGGIRRDYVRLKEISHIGGLRFEPQLSSVLKAQGLVLNERMVWLRERIKMEGRTRYVDAKRVSARARQVGSMVADGGDVTLPLLASYGTERRWYEASHRAKRSSGESRKGYPSRLDGYLDCNLFFLQESALIDWMKRHHGDRTGAWSVLERAVLGCVEGISALSYSNVYKDFVVKIEGEHILSRNLSDGYTVMLMLVGDLVRRIDYLNPQFGSEMLEKTPGIVLIDEIDLHLHPKWQRRILHDLKHTFPAIQFVATTHSPQVIGEALPNEIRVLKDWQVFPVELSYGLDSDRVLEEIQGSERRSTAADSLIHEIALAIDGDRLQEARAKLGELEAWLGPHDREVLRSRRMLRDLDAAICEG